VTVGNVLNLGSSLTTPNGQPLLSVTGGSVNASGSLALLGANLTLGADPSLAGPFLSQSGGSVRTSGDALAVGSNTLTSGTAPVFNVTGGTLTTIGAGSDLVSVSGGTITLGGPLLNLPSGAPTVNIGGDVLNLASTLTGPSGGSVFSVAAGTLTAGGRFLNLHDGSTLTSTSAAPLVQFSSSKVTTGMVARLRLITRISIESLLR
jgi:hypothetical protein